MSENLRNFLGKTFEVEEIELVLTLPPRLDGSTPVDLSFIFFILFAECSVLICLCSEMVRFHLLTFLLISVILFQSSNPSKEVAGDGNIGPSFHSDLNLLPQQSQMLYGVRILKRETFDYYKWPKDHQAGIVIVPYRISRTSYFCKLISFLNSIL